MFAIVCGIFINYPFCQNLEFRLYSFYCVLAARVTTQGENIIRYVHVACSHILVELVKQLCDDIFSAKVEERVSECIYIIII